METFKLSLEAVDPSSETPFLDVLEKYSELLRENCQEIGFWVRCRTLAIAEKTLQGWTPESS
jgi:hypothetical protein